MENYTFLKIAYEVLKQSDTPLSPMEIWEKAVSMGLDKKKNSIGKTPWQTISAQMYVDIRDNIDSIFEQKSVRPLLFGLKDIGYKEREFDEPDDTPNVSSTIKEIALHPVLVKYLDADSHFKCLTKTIRQQATRPGKKSKNANGNQWVFPDLIGIYLPFNEFDDTALETLKYLNKRTYKIFSFEMKKEINWSNYKECYFQAVSNSSWANEGYLVCNKLLEDISLRDEIQILNSAFGIGLIVLDIDNPAESEIVFNAKQRDIDIFMINKLINENEDVKTVFSSLNDCERLGKKVGTNSFDKVFNDSEYSDYIKKVLGE